MKKIKCLFLFALIVAFGQAKAHSLPNSQAQLFVGKEEILIKFHTPLEILELAYQKPINLQSKTSLDSLRHYYLKHISITDSLHSKWNISIGDFVINDAKTINLEDYKQISTDIYLKPSNPKSLNNFLLYCDIILHQVITQSTLFSVQDWQEGINKQKEIGIISWDIPTGKVLPLKIQVAQISYFKTFINLVKLGISHIAEGTDHILFILTLLLPAMLIVEGKNWGKKLGTKESIFNLLKIITAFTIGHSLTLLLGTIQWLNFPSKPIEILIAITILVSAFHAFRPIYPKKEVLIGAGFGLIHGLAFAETLSNLQLSTPQMVLSILGFNVGIELMQLFIILVIFPLLLLLSKTPYYSHFRQGSAIIMMLFAFAWLIERIQEKPNFITELIN